MATGGTVAGSNTRLTYRQDDNGDYVYHPSGQYSMSQQEATDANARNRAARNQSNASATGGIALQPVGGSGGGYGVGGSGSSYSGGGGGYGAGTVTGTPASVVSSPGSGGGDINLSRPAYEDQQAMLLKAQLADKAFGRISGSMTGGASPTVNYGGDGQAEAARAAAFARAKEQAGQTAAASLRTLQDVAARRGIRGSTIESGMISDAVQGGTGAINEFTREQLLQDLANTQHIADTTYQGGITQRGQDLSARQAMLSILAGLY